MSSLYDQSLTRVKYLITPQVYNQPDHDMAIRTLKLFKIIEDDLIMFSSYMESALLHTEKKKLPPQLDVD